MSEEFEEADVEGRTLRYICRGEGTPPVVIDQGHGLSIERGFERPVKFGWAKVFTEIQKSTRILMHDRAGLGFSQQPHRPRASQDMVKDLRAILFAAQLAPPYVLVGHSIGGLNVLTFAAQYPDEVAGVVLIESSHPDQMARIAKVLPPESSSEPLPLRLLRKGIDPASSTEMIDFTRSALQSRTLASLGAIPLVVVSQSPHAFGPPEIPGPVWEAIRTVWGELQADLLTLSANSRQLVARHAGHLVQAEEPQLVIDAIIDVVRNLRGAASRGH